MLSVRQQRCNNRPDESVETQQKVQPSLCAKQAVGQGNQEGKKFPRSINFNSICKAACGTLSPAKGRRSEYRIELLPGTLAAISCKVYPLNRKETDILQILLEEEQRKEYIARGSFPYTVPVFFCVRKKDSDELRPVMDYREID